MMRELFLRTRESTLVGFLPVFLLGWAHLNAQPLTPLLIWTGSLITLLAYRFLVAHLFLIRPEAQAARRQRWFALEWLGAVGLAAGWVSSLNLLGTGEMDALFYLRLMFLVGLTSFLLSAIGIEIRIYASFLVVMVAGTLTLLSLSYPDFVTQLPVVTAGFMVYAVMLLVRSRGEYQRTKGWITARLNEKWLMAQLNQTIAQERKVQEKLRAQSLELENTNRQLSELAIHDGLTHAFRRGHIETELRRIIKGLQRRHSNFCVLMLDIDFFKRVNDRYGHAVGDEVLRRIAALAQMELRENDLFGRWGGEEFMALMPYTTLQEATEAAQRLRLAIQAMVFSGENTTFQITISIGVAQLQPQEDADALVGRVDEALYAAKRAGRNRVMAAPASKPAFDPALMAS